jgi:colanic acid/amylovoran biosynthesis glycosyltransferase
MKDKNVTPSNPTKLVYLIGTYPELTNTFIDREIATIRRLGKFQIQIVSIRYPRTIESCSAEQKSLCDETLYLIPRRWAEFNFLAFIAANFYFAISQPAAYFGCLAELLAQTKPTLKAWVMTVLYFWQGVYAAWLLRGTAFEHVHVHFMDRAVLVALVVSRLLGKTYSFTAHAADIFTHTSLVRKKIEQAQFMVTVSQYNKQYLLKTYPGIDAEKIHILHPWVDISQFSPSGERKIHDRLQILCVGRLVEKKGQADLIEACDLLREKGVEVDCKIVGDGPLRDDYEKQIAQKGLQDSVHLTGGLPQDHVLGLLREWADVFALPCVIAANGDRDGIPVSLAEAMAMELPVVSTDIVGIRELIQPGAGILVPPHAPGALADALGMIAELDQPSLSKMGHVGREVVDREFNLWKGTQDLSRFYSQAIGNRTDAPQKEVNHATI